MVDDASEVCTILGNKIYKIENTSFIPYQVNKPIILLNNFLIGNGKNLK